MKRLFFAILAAVCLLTTLSCSKKSNDYPIPRTEARTHAVTSEPEKKEDLEPDAGYINVNIPKEGTFDLYKAPEELPGYRYGPSFIVYEDGTIDAWFAAGGSGLEQWDWIVYKHYDGSSWSDEKTVLQPTPNSLDHYSCCDPGVIYVNGYYYLAYTSTIYEEQTDNSLFVARSRQPDGPYEKWNGSGWGGSQPVPIVYFPEERSLWGVGEASFVELDGTLYMYYTYDGETGRRTMVATADALDENWPAALEHKGIALENADCDSLDVKYVDKYQRFMAVASEKRLSKDSFLAFYESKDGLSFTKVDACKRNVYEYCHNAGMSGSENGHIIEGRWCFVSYAYGPEWGVWNTAVQNMTLSQTERADLMEEAASNVHVEELARDDSDTYSLEYTGISARNSCVIRVPLSQTRVMLKLYACKRFHDEWTDLHYLRDEISFSGYDETVIIHSGNKSLIFDIVNTGQTMITADFNGHLTYVYVIIYDDTATGEAVGLEPLVQSEFGVSISDSSCVTPQIKSILTRDDGAWEIVCGEDQGVSYSYDGEALTVDEKGCIYGKRSGSYTVEVSYGSLSHTVTVNVK